MLRVTPVARFRIVMLALGTTFPSGSVTTPLTLPPAICAGADGESAKQMSNTPIVLAKLHFCLIASSTKKRTSWQLRALKGVLRVSCQPPLRAASAHDRNDFAQRDANLFHGALTHNERVQPFYPELVLNCSCRPASFSPLMAIHEEQ